MSSKLTDPILEQAYEVVRDRIGEILACELPNQFALQPSVTELNASVFVERWIPVNESERQIVVVNLSHGLWDNKTHAKEDGNYTYNIDAYTAASGTASEEGDALSLKRLQRLLGVCRQILESPVYIRLGFDIGDPVVLSRFMREIRISQPENNMDATFRMMGRLSFDVRMNEGSQQLLPKALNEHVSEATLDETTEGYRYVINT